MGLFTTVIRVPAEELHAAADKMRSFAEDQGGIFDRLSNTLEALRSSGEWDGASWRAAAEKMEENKQKFDETISDLEELALFMQTFAADMTAKDNEIAQQINAV